MYGPYPSGSQVGTAGFFDVVEDIGKGAVNVAKGAAKAASSAVSTVTDAASDAISAVAHAVEKVPVVGDVTQIVSKAAAAPLQMAQAIASGARVDRAVMGTLKKELEAIKDIAPYAQTVTSLVPGIGSGVAAGIAAGAALAEGRDLDDIAKAAVRSALPGGPAVAAGYDAALKVAAGGNIAQAALEAARSQLPPEQQKAFDIGLAVVTGENLQKAITQGLIDLAPEQLKALLHSGEQALGRMPGLALMLRPMGGSDFANGFKTALGVLGHAGINEKALAAMRSRLPEAVRKGFDAALRTQEKNLAWLSNVRNAPTTPAARTPPRLMAPPKPTPPKLAPPPPRTPPKLMAPPPKAPPAPPAASPAASSVAPRLVKTLAPATRQAAAGAAPASTPAASGAAPVATTAATYGPYPQPGTVAGFWGDTWRWFVVYVNGRPVSQRGPVKMSDNDALREEAGFLESTQGRGGIGSVARWDWDEDARKWRQGRGAVGLAGCGGPPCRAFSAPIVDMPHGMHRAGLSAVQSNRGRPRMVSAPDGRDYQFALEGSRLVARECLR